MLEPPDEVKLARRIINKMSDKKFLRFVIGQVADVPSKLRSVIHPFFQPKSISISELREGLQRLGCGGYKNS